jgi:hypothetical protein
MQPHHRIDRTDANVTLASSNNALPDDGDCIETCRSYFNVNFNVNFKTVLRQFICASEFDSRV